MTLGTSFPCMPPPTPHLSFASVNCMPPQHPSPHFVGRWADQGIDGYLTGCPLLLIVKCPEVVHHVCFFFLLEISVCVFVLAGSPQPRVNATCKIDTLTQTDQSSDQSAVSCKRDQSAVSQGFWKSNQKTATVGSGPCNPPITIYSPFFNDRWE